MDNSPFQKWQIVAGTNFDETTSWREWCDAGQAGSVPGAVEFVKFASERGIKPIFITTRENVTRKGTAENLHKLGLLDDDELRFELAYPTDPAGQQAHAMKTRLFMKKMTKVSVSMPNGTKDYILDNKFDQRVFCERVRGFEIAFSIGDSLGDYAEYYGSLVDKDGAHVQA